MKMKMKMKMDGFLVGAIGLIYGSTAQAGGIGELQTKVSSMIKEVLDFMTSGWIISLWTLTIVILAISMVLGSLSEDFRPWFKRILFAGIIYFSAAYLASWILEG